VNAKLRSGLMLLAFVAVCFAAGAIGGVATSMSVKTWYVELNKPTWNPPSWVFGPVWTVLYVMMAVAAWLVWRRTGFKGGRKPLGLFAWQLVLNAGWSWIFFGLRDPMPAFFELGALWFAIAATAVVFWKTSRVASLLLVPYLLWTTFAGVLNFVIWRLNL